MDALSDFLENKLLDHVLKGTSYSPPTDVFVALHLATDLNAQANAAQADIVVNEEIADVVGLAVVVDPGGPNEETRTVASRSGTGPWTITLDSNLANTHPVGTLVKFDIDDPVATLNEPAGGAYARLQINNVALAFTAAAAGATSNNEEWAFAAATADWGLVTALVIMSLAAAGASLFYGNLTVAKTVQNGDTFKFAAGALDVSLS